MGRGGRSAIALAVLLAGCSSGDDVDVAPATSDEQRALEDARAMIPADEIPTETPTATESAKP